MNESADSAWDLRRVETTRRLIRAARRVTAEHGLTGFTLEELCRDAAVSRRTFFNYFASKDDAVLGVPIARADAAAVAEFRNRADATARAAGRLSPTLLADLADLAEARWRALDVAPDTIADLMAAVEREPRLLRRMFELMREGELFDARLIAEREGLDDGDLRAQVAAQLMGAVARAAADDFFRRGEETTFADCFTRRIHAAADLFTSQNLPTGASR